MTLPDGIIDREKGKFVEDAGGNVAVRMVGPTSRYGLLATKSVAFDGTSGNGATGTVDLFTVTGDVICTITSTCSENLVSAGGGTCEVGISGSINKIIAQTTATDIDSGEIWHDATPDASIEALTRASETIISNGNDIILTVDTADVTDGTIDFYCLYTPLSSTGAVVAA